MKCKKCGIDLPDLTMYCPECGTPQFEASKPDIQLTGAVSRSKVVIIGINNMTEAVQYLRGTTGQSMPEVMKMLKTLPLDYAVNLTEEKANEMVKGMCDNGLNAVAVHPQAPKPAPAPQEVPVIQEECEEAPAIQEAPVVEEPAPVEAPAEEKPSFDEEMAAFMSEQTAEAPAVEETPACETPVPEEAEAEETPIAEEPVPAEVTAEEEKPSFEEEMAAFMGEQAEETPAAEEVFAEAEAPVVEEPAPAPEAEEAKPSFEEEMTAFMSEQPAEAQEEEPAPAETPIAEEAAAEEPSDEEEVSVQNEGFDAASASFAQSSEAFLDLQDDEPKEEYVPQLTLDPNHESDDAFMKEMEEFLKN